jgi:hypothetical protein
MRRFVIALGCVGMMVMCGVAIALPSQADDFEVLWAIDLPRELYFIGETVSFSVLAYSSGEVSVFLPGEMALVTIRNSSYSEMYAGWITTNINGSCPVSWDIPLESEPSNYTIILQPIVGTLVTKNFIALFDQDTYWQKRVEFLEDELNRQYEYLNYLFGTNKYLLKQVSILKDQVAIAGVVMMITIMATLWVVIPEWAKRSSDPDNKTISGRLARLLGFSNTPKVLLTEQHEELAQLRTPLGRRPPRCGMEHYCEFCDPDKKEPMVKNDYESHLLSHYRRLHGRNARRKNRIYKRLVSEHYEIPELRPPHEQILAAEKKRDEIIDRVELSRKELRAIDAERTKLDKEVRLEKKRLAKLEKKEKKAVKPLKEDKPPKKDKPAKKKREKKVKSPKKDKTLKLRRKKPVDNDYPPEVPESQRKVRRIKQHTGIPKKEAATHPTSIDELYDKLFKEKVN